MSSVRDEIRNLSVVEKLELIDALWESLEADEQLLTAAQREELDVRIAQCERRPDEVVAWEQISARLFKNR